MTTDTREALAAIKKHVCGDKHPAWSNDDAVYASRRYIADLCDAALSTQPAQPSAQGEAVACDKWEGAEEWMPLAWELCADECGEEACTELVWEGGPVPEPWGDRWLKYEGEAKRLIALVRKHVPAAALASAPAAPAQPSATAKKLVSDFARACVYGSDDDRIAAGVALENALASPAAQPVTALAATDAMVLAAARELCKIHAGQCQVDEQDTWNVYGEQFKDDARDALNAALAASPQPVAVPADVVNQAADLLAKSMMLADADRVRSGALVVEAHNLLVGTHAASPQPGHAGALTEEQLRDLAKYAGLDWQRGYVVDDIHNRYEDFARAIERAHGIKAAP